MRYKDQTERNKTKELIKAKKEEWIQFGEQNKIEKIVQDLDNNK